MNYWRNDHSSPWQSFFQNELHSWTVLPVLGAGYVQGIWVEIRISSEICVNDMFSNLNVAKSIAGRNCIWYLTIFIGTMIYHLTQGETFINQTSIIEWFSFTLSAELFQINIDGQAAMSGDEDAAVLDGVVAADETQAHQEGGLVHTWKCLEGVILSNLNLKTKVMDSQVSFIFQWRFNEAICQPWSCPTHPPGTCDLATPWRCQWCHDHGGICGMAASDNITLARCIASK